MACVLPNQRQAALDDCQRRYPLPSDLTRLSQCRAGVTVCADVAPTVDPNASGITLLGVYRTCNPQPTILALYPPPAPLPNEAAAISQAERLATQTREANTQEMRLRYRASAARKLQLGTGFYLGLGLCGLGAAALYFTRR